MPPSVSRLSGPCPPVSRLSVLRLAVLAAALAAAAVPVGAQTRPPAPIAAPAGSGAAAVGSQPPALVLSAPREAAGPGEVYTLERLRALARTDNPALNASRALSLAVQAGVQGAAAYPNPQIEALLGDVRARRSQGGASGAGAEFGVAQPIENPALRRARIAAAQASAQGAEANVAVAEAGVMADVRQRYFDVLRAQEEVQAARDDLALAEQILDRIRVRVRVGESPRFDLVRAETEVAVARRNVVTAQTRVGQAKALLRLAVAPSLPATFAVEGEPERPLEGAALLALRDAMMARSPALRAAQAEIARAERQIGVERGLVLPNVAVRVLHTTAPDANSLQAGVYLNVPLFDRRAGPIRAATEQLTRARFDAEQRRFELVQSFEAALQAYQASSEQLRALEGGIIAGARNSLEIAEAAYRFGERGIIEFLDAQRTFRAVRNELIAARYGVQAARIELERLAGLDGASGVGVEAPAGGAQGGQGAGTGGATDPAGGSAAAR